MPRKYKEVNGLLHPSDDAEEGLTFLTRMCKNRAEILEEAWLSEVPTVINEEALRLLEEAVKTTRKRFDQYKREEAARRGN